MKPIVPAVPLHVWRILFLAAREFYDLRPWEQMNDSDLICIRDTASGRTGFGCVMGSLGTLFGFCLYRDARGFELVRRMHEEAEDFSTEELLTENFCLNVEFSDRGDLAPEDFSIIRQLGLSIKGSKAWPVFRSNLPGHVPWFLHEEEAAFLTLGLKTASHHYRQLMEGNVSDSLRASECLVYTHGGSQDGAFRSTWEPRPAYVRPAYDPPVLDVARMSALRSRDAKPDGPWQAGVFALPSPIFDAARPYFMRMTAVVNQKNAYAFHHRVAEGKETIPQLLADGICAAMEEHGLRPESVFVAERDLSRVLAPMSKSIGVPIRTKRDLAAINFMRGELLKGLRRR